jgi:hypothetical protein
MEKFPLCVPEAVGVKATATVQPVLAARLAPQVFAVILKSTPVTDGVCNAIGVAPVFEIVMFCTGLVAPIVVEGKVTSIGLRTIGVAALPVPESAAVACPPATFP